MSSKPLVDMAIAARATAHAPYSGFRVGAAVELGDGRRFAGVNVENCSYGLTVCAERHAVAAAVLGGARPGDIRAVAIAADADGPTPPCGACRQVLREVGLDATLVLMHNVRDGSVTETTLGALLPHAFVATSIPKR